MNTQAILDHGENDPLEFTLGNWAPVVAVVKRELEEQTGRELTDVNNNAGDIK